MWLRRKHIGQRSQVVITEAEWLSLLENPLHVLTKIRPCRTKNAKKTAHTPQAHRTTPP